MNFAFTILTPNSSCISLVNAFARVSPASTCPPGISMYPGSEPSSILLFSTRNFPFLRKIPSTTLLALIITNLATVLEIFLVAFHIHLKLLESYANMAYQFLQPMPVNLHDTNQEL